MISKALLPFAFTAVGRHRMVKLVDPARLDWRHGFFGLGLAEERPIEHVEAFDAWVERPLPGDFSGLGAIFHVSRCGSTLLSQNLKATGRAVVLSEPVFLRILRGRVHDSVTPEMALRAVAQAMADWLAWAQAQGKVLIVKFNSQVHVFREELMRVMPGARFLFLHREPAPVLESILRGPPPYLKREAGRDRFPTMPELDGIDDVPLLLAATSRYCAALDAFMGSDAAACPQIGYPDLAREFPAICRHFGLGEIDGSMWDAARNAKSVTPGDGEPYRPVGADRIAQFNDSHRAVVAVAEARYRTFCDAARAAPATLGALGA